MKYPLIDGLGLKISGVSPRERLAACCLIALELRHIQESEGYCPGQHVQFPQASRRPTWPKLLKQQVGISDRTALNWDRCAQVVGHRLQAEQALPSILKSFNRRPSELSVRRRAQLWRALSEWMGDTTASELLREFRNKRRLHAENAEDAVLRQIAKRSLRFVGKILEDLED